MEAEKEFKLRTKRLGLDVIQLVSKFPRSIPAQVITRQIVRSATSVGANYRAACRARSRAEMVSKLQIVLEEADETCYWLELVEELLLVPPETVQPIADESDQLVAMVQASIKTLLGKRE